MIEIKILDYGLGNIRSLYNALEKIDQKVELLKYDGDIAPKILFIPGVGSFNKASKILQENFPKTLKAIKNKNTFVVGICLGMQLMAKTGYEDGKIEGLNLLSGTIDKMSKKNIKLPNIGWKKISICKNNNLSFLNKYNKKKFYFVHSYSYKNVKKENLISTSKYLDINFPCIVSGENCLGFQFHPEKSGKLGLNLLKETLKFIKKK